MRFVISAVIVAGLAGCSVAFSSQTRCSLTPPAVDGVLAAAAIGAGLYSLSLPGTSPAGDTGRILGVGISFTFAASFIGSAGYGVITHARCRRQP